ncbi:uncharacterized protein N7473_001764 [Penicillium subrubescens]|uniref:uncharacterized protein n=1 Tax=Penicillium subrubescens TaxID=1316194 RepID=UPI0025457C6E|nr:uncharacterized protein N7473_001764 [Penicillium subrubescens]KAJ5904848.1 hypothetical protein N7473_001764 [Penicillium subrubescens]
MESTQFDDTLLPVFDELDMAIFMPSIDLAAPSEAPIEAPDDASDDAILVPDMTWPTYLAGIDWINEQACLSGSGFGAVIKNSKKRRDRTLKTVYLRCDRGYNRPKARDHPKRKSYKKATKCQWRAVIRLEPTGDWTLRVQQHRHNHGPIPASAMPVQRRRQRERFIS